MNKDRIVEIAGGIMAEASMMRLYRVPCRSRRKKERMREGGNLGRIEKEEKMEGFKMEISLKKIIGYQGGERKKILMGYLYLIFIPLESIPPIPHIVFYTFHSTLHT